MTCTCMLTKQLQNRRKEMTLLWGLYTVYVVSISGGQCVVLRPSRQLLLPEPRGPSSLMVPSLSPSSRAPLPPRLPAIPLCLPSLVWARWWAVRLGGVASRLQLNLCRPQFPPP